MKVRILHLLADMQLKAVSAVSAVFVFGAVSAVFVFGMCHIVP